MLVQLTPLRWGMATLESGVTVEDDDTILEYAVMKNGLSKREAVAEVLRHRELAKATKRKERR